MTDAAAKPALILATFTVPDEVLAIEGDIEYGEYLASECLTCHQADGDNDGIPGIVGLDPEYFVMAMHAYRAKHRENPVMQLVAGRLADDEIAALAAYFNSLDE
ncbi:MAG: c-type cytochrome [Pseudomonadota bacterium]